MTKTTLTRERLLSSLAVRFEWVDVNGETVGIREPTEFRRLHRINQRFDDSGQPVAMHIERRRVYMLIDQLMIDETTQMFTEGDADELGEMSGPRMDAYVEAIMRFNGELGGDDAKKKDEDSRESNES